MTDPLAIILLTLLVVGFVLVWMLLHRSFKQKRGRQDSFGGGLDASQLDALKDKLTPEEYKKLQQAMVSKMLNKDKKPEEKTLDSVSLEELEATVRTGNMSVKKKEKKND